MDDDMTRYAGSLYGDMLECREALLDFRDALGAAFIEVWQRIVAWVNTLTA